MLLTGLEGGPVVESIEPRSGFAGTTLNVRVVGSGYDEGSEVRFERDGAPSADVRANSTTFVSSEELVANITISQDAPSVAYDVVVLTGDRKRGIGLEGFIVSVVVVGTLPGGVNSVAFDVNDNGEVVGRVFVGFPGEPGFDGDHATYWFADALVDLGRGTAMGISSDCAVGDCRVVGRRDGRPVVWHRENGVWTSFELPTETGEGSANAINDRGDRIAGNMRLRSGPMTAAVWTEIDGAWSVAELPPAALGLSPIAHAINDVGQVVGQAAGRAIVWTDDGAGWTPHELDPLPGDTQAVAFGINNAGDVVGSSGAFAEDLEGAALWRRRESGWEPPIDLVPPDPVVEVERSGARDINDKGEVVGTFVDPKGRQIGYLWTERTGLLDLGVIDDKGTNVFAISERNQIAGTVEDVALLWTFSLGD